MGFDRYNDTEDRLSWGNRLGISYFGSYFNRMKKDLNIYLHLGFWVIIWGIPLIVTLTNTPEITPQWRAHIIYANLFTMVSFYYSYWLVTPLILKKKNWLSGLPLFIGAGLILVILKFSGYYIMNPLIDNLLSESKLLRWPMLLGDAFNTMLVMVIAVLIRISMNYARDRQTRADMRLQQQSTELALLKAQINPHFFFNTLNNIYSLVYKKSDDAPAALLKLSEIMRYMLYESKSDTVPLGKELIHLDNYLELEKLRMKEDSFVSYKIRGNPNGYMVPPMLLLTFVENAFKHGKRKVDHPGVIIRLQVGSENLNFTVINYTQDHIPRNPKSEGIGLQNVSRRLELLYPDCHELEISHIRNQFKVSLTLKCQPKTTHQNEN